MFHFNFFPLPSPLSGAGVLGARISQTLHPVLSLSFMKLSCELKNTVGKHKPCYLSTCVLYLLDHRFQSDD